MIEVVDEKKFSSELDAAVRKLLCEMFPDWESIFRNSRTWHQTRPIFSVIAKNIAENDTQSVIGHIAVVVRTITTTWNFRYNVASIQGVCVASEYRHHGIAHELLAAAVAESARRGFPFAILYCKEPLVKFYESQSWKLADESIVMWNKRDLPISMRSNCPMYYELGDATFPEGPIDVHSPIW